MTELIDPVLDMLEGIWQGRALPQVRPNQDNCPVPLEEPEL